jgi:hypothetical protein
MKQQVAEYSPSKANAVVDSDDDIADIADADEDIDPDDDDDDMLA